MYRKAPQTSQLNKQKSCTSDVFYSISILLCLQVSALTFQLPAVRSTEEGTCSNVLPPRRVPLFWQLFSHIDKRIIIKIINTNGIQTMGREKNQTSPQTSRDHDHEGSVCTSHNSNISIYYTAAVTTPPFLINAWLHQLLQSKEEINAGYAFQKPSRVMLERINISLTSPLKKLCIIEPK